MGPSFVYRLAIDNSTSRERSQASRVRRRALPTPRDVQVRPQEKEVEAVEVARDLIGNIEHLERRVAFRKRSLECARVRAGPA